MYFEMICLMWELLKMQTDVVTLAMHLHVLLFYEYKLLEMRGGVNGPLVYLSRVTFWFVSIMFLG